MKELNNEGNGAQQNSTKSMESIHKSVSLKILIYPIPELSSQSTED